MRFFQASPDAFSFEFNQREKDWLFQVLERYPLIPAGHHRLSRQPAALGNEHQAWLEESLAAHREEARRKLRQFMTNPGNFPADGDGFRWTASRADLEWMLQVLNDVRVGSWLALGSPDLQAAKFTMPTPETRAHYLVMDIAGGLETIFIAALSGELPTPRDDAPAPL